MERSAHVIANAAAGQGCSDEWAREVEAKFRKRGIGAHVTRGRSGEDILATAEHAANEGAPLVVAAGGDGTVNAVASKLVGTDTTLGVLPMGTLNHFAKDLGIPLELEGAIDVIAHGRQMAVDVGEVNGRIFINNSSLGLYPDIVRDRERQRRRLGRGKWAALLFASVQAAKRYPVLSLQLEVDGRSLNRRSAFIFIGNNEYNMEGFEIGERSSITGGALSLYVTQRTGRFGLLLLALRALLHRLRQARDFDMLAATSVVIHTPRKTIRVSTDGEVTVMKTPLDYRIRPGALRVWVPQKDAD